MFIKVVFYTPNFADHPRHNNYFGQRFESTASLEGFSFWYSAPTTAGLLTPYAI